jgi:hypothetical protein
MALINKNSKMFFSGNLVLLIKELRIQKFNNPFLQICSIYNFRMLRTNCYLSHNKYRNKKFQVVRKLGKKILILLWEIRLKVYQGHLIKKFLIIVLILWILWILQIKWTTQLNLLHKIRKTKSIIIYLAKILFLMELKSWNQESIIQRLLMTHIIINKFHQLCKQVLNLVCNQLMAHVDLIAY